MNRRKFINIGLGAVAAAAVLPSTLSAVDFRKEKPKAWSHLSPTKKDKAGKDIVDAENLSGVKGSIKELYGTDATVDGGVKLKAPDIAENGAVIPLSFSTDKKAKTIAVFQSANPEATVAVFTVPPRGKADYSIRIKMQQTGTVMVVAEADDGKLYSASKVVKVTMGGCGG
jgi:sulfur-oxidizing protein SoxY